MPPEMRTLQAIQNRNQSLMSERRVEDRTGLGRIPGSGCGRIFKGDNGNRLWHYEDKSTRKDALCIKLGWLIKAETQARDTKKIYYALGVSGKVRIVVVPATLAELAGLRPAAGFDSLSAVQNKSVTKPTSYFSASLVSIETDEYVPVGFFDKERGRTQKFAVISEETFSSVVKNLRTENIDD